MLNILKTKLINCYKFMLLVKDFINGEFFYQQYLEHQVKNHPGQIPLDRKSFFAKREQEKWQKINRCC